MGQELREKKERDPARRPGPGRPVDHELTERRKQQLIDAAYTEFADRGYHATGITEITRTAGLGRGTFYLYFDTKRDILDGVIDHIIEQILTAIGVDAGTADMHSLDDFETAIRSASAGLFTLLDANPELVNVVLRNGMIDAEITNRVLAVGDAFTATATLAIDNGIDEGFLNSTLDSTSLAYGLTGFALGGLLRGIRGNFPPEERERYINTAVTLLRQFASEQRP